MKYIVEYDMEFDGESNSYSKEFSSYEYARDYRCMLHKDMLISNITITSID